MGFREFVETMRSSQEGGLKSDGVTTDKQLLSLRRQARLVAERDEKERLKQYLHSRRLSDDKKVFSSGGVREAPKKRVAKRFMSAKSTLYS